MCDQTRSNNLNKSDAPLEEDRGQGFAIRYSPCAIKADDGIGEIGVET
jgi:hypothetical protein